MYLIFKMKQNSNIQMYTYTENILNKIHFLSFGSDVVHVVSTCNKQN